MNLTVIGPRAIVRPEKLPDTTTSGLHIVYDRQQSTMRGTVVALGDGPQSPNGTTLDHVVTIGDKVVFSPDSGEELIFEKDVLIAMNEDAILAIIE
jgi:chaperonin GroES